ncbi:MAG TPA: MCE family protein [Bacteroidetes bacterium]|nr:MCE family protein [Bacteroidota bacterium]HIL57072.1 MCE family protein [Rhodothermales bacterium]
MARQARLGLLVIAGLLVGVTALFIIAGQSNLLSDTFRVQAAFNEVAGLQRGAGVNYNGILVGRVDAVRLPGAPGEPILVDLAINEDARPLLREDSKAVIQTDGLVGNVIVSLTDGSPELPPIEEGGRIQGVDPFALTEVTDRLFTSVSRFDSVTVALAGIINDTRSGEGTVGRFLYDDALYNETVLTTQEFRLALGTFAARADALVGIAEQSSRSIDDILRKVNTGDGTVARFLNEDEVYTTFLQTAEQLQGAAAQFQTISADVRSITDRAEQAAGWGALAAFRFAELAEAGKHNFLFKSYFEDRGYLEMAPFEIREQAISETLDDLQDWERRLYQREQEVEALQREVEALRDQLRETQAQAGRPLLPSEAAAQTRAAGGGR